jgi:hypothetical protein
MQPGAALSQRQLLVPAAARHATRALSVPAIRRAVDQMAAGRRQAVMAAAPTAAAAACQAAAACAGTAQSVASAIHGRAVSASHHQQLAVAKPVSAPPSLGWHHGWSLPWMAVSSSRCAHPVAGLSAGRCALLHHATRSLPSTLPCLTLTMELLCVLVAAKPVVLWTLLLWTPRVACSPAQLGHTRR